VQAPLVSCHIACATASPLLDRRKPNLVWPRLIRFESSANVYDAHFHPLIAQFVGRMIILTDTGFHAKTGDPANMKLCQHGPWRVRRLVETVLSLLPTVFHTKQMHHRVWEYCCARLAWTMAAFNIWAQWGIEVDDNDMVRVSIADLSR
jgi:hypothetical protein